MPLATVTSKGQITIPAEIRKELKLKPGDRVFFIKNERGRYALYPKNGSVKDVQGILGKFDRIVTLEEMKEAVARGLAEKMEPEEVKAF